MMTLTDIIGFTTDENISGRLHDLSHSNDVEYIVLERENTLRKRLRVTGDKGTDCAIALSRDQKLEDGCVLHLDDNRAIVLRMAQEHWLSVKPADSAAAVELGYFAGNLHWRVRFDGDIMLIAIEGPIDFYLGRLQPYLDDGRARVLSDE
ncbi:MAG: urease accessory protein UreE [Rhodospirillales bacterium]|jgi:urease accessory protein|nr:urease accessory protein UreE [Rhodospirillales bacterium]